MRHRLAISERGLRCADVEPLIHLSRVCAYDGEAPSAYAYRSEPGATWTKGDIATGGSDSVPTKRIVLLLPFLGVAGATIYGTLANVARVPVDPESALGLTLVAFVPGLVAHVIQSILPILAREPRLAPILARRWHLFVIGYAQSVVVLVCFLEAAVLGLI